MVDYFNVHTPRSEAHHQSARPLSLAVATALGVPLRIGGQLVVPVVIDLRDLPLRQLDLSHATGYMVDSDDPGGHDIHEVATWLEAGAVQEHESRRLPDSTLVLGHSAHRRMQHECRRALV